MIVWIYGKDKQDIEKIKGLLDLSADKLIGTSVKAGAGSTFPDSGLIRPVGAVISPEIDALVISGNIR